MPKIVKYEGSRSSIVKLAAQFRKDHFSNGCSVKDRLNNVVGSYCGLIEFSKDAYSRPLWITDSEFVIYIPNELRDEDEVWHIANGIGHYFLHVEDKNTGGNVSIWNDDDKVARRQAVWFAMELLMPGDEFISMCDSTYRKFNGYGMNYVRGKIANKFGVSVPKVVGRMFSLNYTWPYKEKTKHWSKRLWGKLF